MNWSNWPAWITLAVAIVTPSITAYLNNRHQMKLKKLEMFATRRMDAIENYLSAASDALYTTGVPDSFAAHSVTVLLYAPEASIEKIEHLNFILEGKAFSEEAKKLLFEVAVELKAEHKIA